MLPDLEALQESFEIPAQLRMDLLTTAEAPQQQGDPSRDSAYSQSHSQHYSQHHSQHHSQHRSHPQHQAHPGADSTHKDVKLYRTEHHSGHVSGATTPSGPRSSASDESLHPSGHYSHGRRPQQGAAEPWLEEATDLSPAQLAHSKSLPLLDGFEGLTELQQQAADMLADVSGEPSIIHAVNNLKQIIKPVNQSKKRRQACLPGLGSTTGCLPLSICLNTPFSSLFLHRWRHPLDTWQHHTQSSCVACCSPICC